jgi:hypothetical protein
MVREHPGESSAPGKADDQMPPTVPKRMPFVSVSVKSVFLTTLATSKAGVPA